MCLRPISIPNPTKFVSLLHRDRFLLSIPCGCCSECQRTLHNQWYYRAYYEWLNCAENDGYIMLDCLTYDNKHLPKLSHVWQFLDKKVDFPCFSRIDVRKFIDMFYHRIQRAGFKGKVRHFLCGEYGTDPNKTHRPHYHLLLYVQSKDIDPVWLSNEISDCWSYGRTDGVKYRGRRYVLSHNFIDCSNAASSLRSCSYVTKYVQKSSEFQSEIDKRLAIVMRSMADYVVDGENSNFLSADSWLESAFAKRERQKLKRYVNQFHRQNQGFGLLALRDLDLSQYMNDGVLYMPDSKGLKIPVVMPTYYKRKLFSELITLNDGSRYWQLNSLGVEFRNRRKLAVIKSLKDRYDAYKLHYNMDFDSDSLADYVYNYRGRVRADLPESTILERFNIINQNKPKSTKINYLLFNYCTLSDRLQFGKCALSFLYLGSPQVGYTSDVMRDCISIKDFIRRNVIIDDDKENILSVIDGKRLQLNVGKQKAFDHLQRLKSIYQLCT